MLGASEVQDQEVAHDGVEGAGLERKLMYVRLAEIKPRMKPAGEVDHRLGDVDSNHGCASLGRARRHVTGAGGEIEHVRSRPYGGGVEERLDEAARDAPEEAVIAGRLLFPTSCLEGIEGCGIDRGLPHSRKVLLKQHRAS